MTKPRRDGPVVQQHPSLWWQAVQQALTTLFDQISASSVRAIAVDGTSGTLAITDKTGSPLGPALMYNDTQTSDEAAHIKQIAPNASAAHGTASGLAKLLWWQRQPCASRAYHIVHQADWINAQLCGRLGISDVNNCLKTGYDPLKKEWPQWLQTLVMQPHWLPEVVPPGTPIGKITTALAKRFGLGPDTMIVAGTTDSTAAFMATGAHQPGEAVTSLGSTLVLKLITTRPIFAPQYGVYSQPLGDMWLAGGGSNSGGAVLAKFFSPQQMATMTPLIDPATDTGLDYYPLVAPGERFPINDPALPPRLEPRPNNDVTFFQAMLEGIARIEQSGYHLLTKLDAPDQNRDSRLNRIIRPVSIRSIGGGSQNPAWSQIRGRLLQTPLLEPQHREAAYGTALLALQGSNTA